jgi:SAM-dependent methyltransferase
MSGYGRELAESFVAVADDRRLTLFPRLLERIRRRGAKTLLDYGGGDGDFARTCAALPLQRVVTYDLSPEMTALAARASHDHETVHVVARTTDLAGRSFDVVTSNGVWMCWTTEDACVANLSEIRRLLAPDGVFLGAVTHPCFRDRRFATYRTDFDMDRYLDDGTAFRVKLFDGEREVELLDTHWSLTAMLRQLCASCLQLTDLEEIADPSGAAGSPWLIVEARIASTGDSE